MASLLPVGRSDWNEREIYCITLPTFDSLTKVLKLPSQHFTTFVAGDATSVDPKVLVKFSRLLLASGCVYFCSWGPDCERVHDCFDDQCDSESPLIMTTWHDGDSLDEALWFFVSDAHPVDEYSSTCRCAVAISIGNAAWAKHIRVRLNDIDGLKKNVVDEA